MPFKKGYTPYNKLSVLPSKNCEECGTSFSERPCFLENRKYCSRKCFEKAHSKNGSTEIICLTCGKSFPIKKHAIDSRKYCSRECWIKSDTFRSTVDKFCISNLGTHYTEEHSKNQSIAQTGRVFSEVTLERMKGTKGRTNEWRIGVPRPEMSGENNWNWRGGISLWDAGHGISWKEWGELRIQVLQRDGWVCQEVGCTNSIDNAIMDVHHIDPYRFSKNNSPENLVSLCRTCHLRREYKVWKEKGFSFFSSFKKTNQEGCYV